MPHIPIGRIPPPRVWLIAALLGAFVVSFALYVYWEKRIDSANEQRYLSHLVAAELRQSSDDLTRMVRTYVVTGDPIYKQSYQDILDIRDGRRIRPDNYENIYWDLALLDNRFSRPAVGAGLPLLERMRQAGFTEGEFHKLAMAKANSDGLTAREFAAMKLFESGGPDRQANRMAAILMMHDETYHRAKVAIMDPINAFYGMVEARTLATVRHAEAVALALRLTFIAFTIAVAAFLWRTYAESRAILGGSVQDVHTQITTIGQGDFSTLIPVSPGLDNSVLAELARMAAKLDRLKAERSSAIAELRDKNEALLRSNADLEQFAYVASHDLQTPLRNVVSYAQLLDRRYKGRLDADADDFIGFIVDSAKRMTQLINDLLEYARITSQDRPLLPTPADKAVTRALGNLKAVLDQSGADIAIGNLPPVMAEPSHLVSLFQNLLGNALKYRMPDRPLRLSVTAERIDPEWWRFAVADNGIGIEPAYHDKIFEIFQRLDPASELEGTGIGLALCRRIVHRFGGAIWIESTPHRGTTVFFTLQDVSAAG